MTKQDYLKIVVDGYIQHPDFFGERIEYNTSKRLNELYLIKDFELKKGNAIEVVEQVGMSELQKI